MKQDFSHLKWNEIGRRKERDCRIFDLYTVERESSDGKKGSFTLLDAPDWVNIVALARNEADQLCFVMVRQYRHGLGTLTLEFPAGTVEPGEDPAVAAARELEEETGFRPVYIYHAGSVSPNPAFMNNMTHTYVVPESTSTGLQELDEHEYVDWHLIPVEEVEENMGQGEYANGIMLIALSHYHRWKRSAEK